MVNLKNIVTTVSLIVFSLGFSFESYGKNKQIITATDLDKISETHLSKITEFYENKMDFDLDTKFNQRIIDSKKSYSTKSASKSKNVKVGPS